jgi:hypothetical protein
LIGAKVSGTIRKGILDPREFDGSETELMLGYVSALLGCCVWLILATILNLPVSGTHSIVGATIGMAIVSKGINVIKWIEIIKIGFFFNDNFFILCSNQTSYFLNSVILVHFTSVIRCCFFTDVFVNSQIYSKSGICRICIYYFFMFKYLND